MTHITKGQALELVNKLFTGAYWRNEEVAALCNAAIQTYIDSLSAELPEPVHHIMSDGQSIGYYSREQLTQALAARDAKCDRLSETIGRINLDREELRAERDRAIAAHSEHLKAHAIDMDHASDVLEKLEAERDAALHYKEAYFNLLDSSAMAKVKGEQ